MLEFIFPIIAVIACMLLWIIIATVNKQKPKKRNKLNAKIWGGITLLGLLCIVLGFVIYPLLILLGFGITFIAMQLCIMFAKDTK